MTRRKLSIEPLESRCLLSLPASLFGADADRFTGVSGPGELTSDSGQASGTLAACTRSDDAAQILSEKSARSEVSPAKLAQVAKLGLRRHEFGLFENWGRRGEKWLLGHIGWYFLTPDGSLYKWDASPPGRLTGQLVTQLPAGYHADPEQVLRAQDHYLDGRLGLRRHEAGLFENWGGLHERWLHGRDGWYFITPDGALYRWNHSPPSKLSGTLIARLDDGRYEDVWLLYGAQDYFWDRELGLHLDETGLWENWGGLGEKWLRGREGWFYITPEGQLFNWDGRSHKPLTGRVVAQLDPAAFDQPWRLYGAQDYHLDRTLGLTSHLEGRPENWAGQTEKWLSGRDGSYFVTPRGGLYRWSGDARDGLSSATPRRLSGEFLAQLDPTHYDEPFRLHAASDPVQLADLRIGGPDARMSPPFSLDVDRYAVHRQTSTQGISVTATSLTGAISINGQPALSSAPLELLELEAGQTIAVEVVHPLNGSRRTYEFFVLPIGFPEIEVTTLTAAASRDPIYVGLGKQNREGPYFLAVLDNHGVPTFVQETPRRAGDFKLHPTGQRSYQIRSSSVNEFGRPSTEQVVWDEDFNEVGRFQVAGDLNHTDGHDFQILPNGHFVFLAYHGEVRDGTLFEDSVIQVVDPSTYEEVFRWNSKHDIPYSDRLRESREYAHVNSVQVDAQGNFLASLRGTSQVVKIDGQTAELIWKLGGVSSDFVIDDPLGGPCGQHTASWTPEGTLLVFDNGQLCPPFEAYADHPGVTRAAEYRLDETNMTAELVWSYSRPGKFSRSGGSAQRLGNGNTILGWANSDGSVIATEVDRNGNVVFELQAESDGTPWRSYRVVRFADPT